MVSGTVNSMKFFKFDYSDEFTSLTIHFLCAEDIV